MAQGKEFLVQIMNVFFLFLFFCFLFFVCLFVCLFFLIFQIECMGQGKAFLVQMLICDSNKGNESHVRNIQF